MHKINIDELLENIVTDKNKRILAQKLKIVK